MPKKSNKDELDGSKIINFYEKIPKIYLDNVANPNFHLHKFKTAFRLCCISPSGGGKSNWLMNLLALFSSGEGTFQSIHLITKNADEPLYRWLGSISDQIIIKEGLQNTPQLDKFDKNYSHLVIFDDCVLAKDLSMVEQYYIRARKLNVSVIFISQSYFRIPKMIRNNCSYMVLLKLSGNREVNMILSEFGLGVTKDELIKMYEYATAEKFSPLIIDLEEEADKRFRKGFLEIIDKNKL